MLVTCKHVTNVIESNEDQIMLVIYFTTPQTNITVTFPNIHMQKSKTNIVVYVPPTELKRKKKAMVVMWILQR